MGDEFKLSRKVEDRSTVSLAVFNVGRQKCSPGYEWGPGIRDHYLIHYISSGKGSYICEGTTYKLSAGDLFLVRPDTEVSYRADEREPWTYYWVGFAGTDAGAILETTDLKGKTNLLRNLSYGSELKAQLQRIIDTFGNTFEHTVRMTGELYLLLAILVSHAGGRAPVIRDEAEHVRRAVDYIESHYSYPISIEDVSSYVGVSRSTLFRQFRRCLSISPKEYLERYRIRRATYLLRTTNLTINSVGISVGYDNGLYFSRVFKKATGQSPSAYRSQEWEREE